QFQFRWYDPGRILVKLPWSWRTTARSELGKYAQRWQKSFAGCPAPYDISRRGYLPRRLMLQLARGRPARSLRPAKQSGIADYYCISRNLRPGGLFIQHLLSGIFWLR